MIIVNCPACGAEGRIPNDKINTPLTCKKCLQPFYVRPSGQAALGEPRHAGTAAHPGDGSHAVDHRKDVDNVFENLKGSLKTIARVAAALAVLATGYGLYQSYQPVSLEEQAAATATAFARNDLTSILSTVVEGTNDGAVEWFAAALPEFQNLIHGTPSTVPVATIHSIHRDPNLGTAEVVARVIMADPIDQRRAIVSDPAQQTYSGPYLDIPFVLANEGWSGWQFEGKQSIEAFRRTRAASSTTPTP